MKIYSLVFIICCLLALNYSFAQNKIDTKYMFLDDFIKVGSLKKIPLHIDFIGHGKNHSLINQYSLGKWTGDTVSIVLKKDTVKFVEIRKRSPDFWLFADQYLRSIDDSNLIIIDSCYFESLDSCLFTFLCFYKIVLSSGKESLLNSYITINRKDINGFYVYWPYIDNKKRD